MANYQQVPNSVIRIASKETIHRNEGAIYGMKTPLLYFIGYCLVYFASFLWNVVYIAPKSIEIVIGQENVYYKNEILQGVKIYDLLRFSSTLFAPLILLFLFTGASFLFKKVQIIERLLCLIFFILMIAVLLLNPFVFFNTISELLETYKLSLIILTVVSTIEMLICFAINRRTFNINPIVFTAIASVCLVVAINFIKIANMKKYMTYEPIFPYLERSSEKGFAEKGTSEKGFAEKGSAIQEFCNKHDFPISNVYVETKNYSQGTIAINYGWKQFNQLFIGSGVLQDLKTNEILAVLEHEVEHFTYLGFGFELLLTVTTSFLFFHFIRRRILSNSKNFTMRKVSLAVMQLLVFLKMIDLCNYLLLMLIEYNSDSKAHSQSNTCIGIIGMLSRVLYWSNSMESPLTSVDTISVYHPRSLYHPFPSVVSRILEAFKKCPEDLEFKINYES